MRIRAFSPLAAPLVVFGVAACEVEQEQPAEAPQVEVEPGRLPEYRAETGEAEVGRDTVTVPEVEIEEPNGASGGEGRR